MYQRHDRQVEVKLRHKPPLAHLQEFPIPNAVAGEKLVLLFYVDEGRRVRELVVGDAIVGTCDIAVEQAAGAE